jgi:alpha-N-arabinofuranosidase
VYKVLLGNALAAGRAIAAFGVGLALAMSPAATGAQPIARKAALIDVDARHPLGKVSPYIFGQNLEHEYGSISPGSGFHSGGLWAEMLRDRKFEEGDLDQNGVANAWVPEELVRHHYWELHGGYGLKDRYYLDHSEYYGGGAAQAIEVSDSPASVSQVDLAFSKGRRYVFYVYLKLRGRVTARVDFESVDGFSYGHLEFTQLSGQWARHTADFTATESTEKGRVRISVAGTGTLWVDSASLMPADNLRGMRRDVVEAVKAMHVPLIRYPGGCFVETYHWQDGIGPRDKRPERYSPKWNEWEPNDFGTDEFMEFAALVGAEAHLTVNYLTGSPQEAGEWVAYMNGSAETDMGRVRTQNGHAEPYGVKIWAVGNEAYKLCHHHFFGANDVNEYATRFEKFKAAMSSADPLVRVMAAGTPPGPLKWNHALLGLASFDWMAASIYSVRGEVTLTDESETKEAGAVPQDYDTRIMDLGRYYRHVVGEPLDFAQQLQAIIDGAGTLAPRDRPWLAVTEFQSWWVTEKMDADFRLASALYLAGVYHQLLRHFSEVQIAEIETLINVSGVIEVGQDTLKLTPEYFAYILYRNHVGTTVLNTTTRGPMVNFDAALPALDAQATLAEDGRTLYLAVINRNETGAVTSVIRAAGWRSIPDARVFELNGKDRDAANPFGSSAGVSITSRLLRVNGDRAHYRFPAHSVTVIELSAAG